MVETPKTERTPPVFCDCAISEHCPVCDPQAFGVSDTGPAVANFPEYPKVATLTIAGVEEARALSRIRESSQVRTRLIEARQQSADVDSSVERHAALDHLTEAIAMLGMDIIEIARLNLK